MPHETIPDSFRPLSKGSTKKSEDISESNSS